MLSVCVLTVVLFVVLFVVLWFVRLSADRMTAYVWLNPTSFCKMDCLVKLYKYLFLSGTKDFDFSAWCRVVGVQYRLSHLCFN